jgi:glycosyltransferase involved in cell wall biosynthesis
LSNILFKLAIDCRMINMAGIGTYIKNILPRLIESNEFVIICLGYDDLKAFSWFSKVQYIPVKSRILSFNEQIELAYKIPNCEVFWSPNWNITWLPNKAKHHVVTIHDVYHLANKSKFSFLKIKMMQAYMSFIRLFADSVITVSNFSKSEIIRHSAIPARMIYVIHLAVDEQYTNMIGDCSNEDEYILYVGNVKPHKNLLLSLIAFSQIKDTNLKFYIVGQKDGFITNDSTLNDYIIKLGNRIVFTGKVSDNEVKNYYKNAKLFLFPSTYEGFGLPILEAMKFKLPIITSDSASIPEVAGPNVIYFNAFQVEDLVNKLNNFLSGQISCNISAYDTQLEKFSWDRTTDRHKDIFKKYDEDLTNR